MTVALEGNEEEDDDEEEEYDEDPNDEFEEEMDEWEDDEGYYYEDYENDWTPEQFEEMDRIFEKFIQEIANTYGDDWEEKFGWVIDKEEIYEEYLEFEERKEERRQLIEASHQALLKHKEYIRVEEYSLNMESQNSTEERVSNHKNTATTTIVTTQGGNTHTVIGSI